MNLDSCGGADGDTCGIVDTRAAVPVRCRFPDSKSATFGVYNAFRFRISRVPCRVRLNKARQYTAGS
ncbi:hypothetical protein VNO78_33018 [Psophocarpus tetragonolobus]|uniref:Uncharacterized protein n=1 Tax=Psophocarpus tetragonolobus TaxID=3891 RepID=A0AAN9NW68_PSOTE